MALFLGAGVAGVVAYKRHRRKGKERELDAHEKHPLQISHHQYEQSPPHPYAQSSSSCPYGDFAGLKLQQVLALLIDAVYARDRADPGWRRFLDLMTESGSPVPDARVEQYKDMHWMRMPNCSVTEAEETEVGLAHYLRRDQYNDPSATDDIPQLVIALRGTILSNMQDIVDDIKVGRVILHTSERFRKCEELIRKLIEEFRRDHDGQFEDICLTGHSLGASIALLVAKHLAQEGTYVHAHCFNPPFVTIFSIVEKGLFARKLKDKLRNSPMFQPIVAKSRALKDGAKLLVASLAEGLSGNLEKIGEQYIRFASLVTWVPVLYVNENDFICKDYIDYYSRKHLQAGLHLDTQAIVSRFLGRDVKYFTLVPSVDMHISDLRDDPHALHNWHANPHLPVIKSSSSFRLIPPSVLGPD